MENATRVEDLKWKLKKFIDNGDVSFLGHSIKQLKERISLAESMDVVNSSDIILSVTRSEPCETVKNLKITRVKRDDNA